MNEVPRALAQHLDYLAHPGCRNALFGGETLKDFALAMTIGLVCGCYSSYAIATPLYVIWKTHEPRFKKLQKKYGSDIQRWFLNRLPGRRSRCGCGGCWRCGFFGGRWRFRGFGGCDFGSVAS